MIIYADITFLNNFLMTLAIIWAIASIMELKFTWKHLILGGLVANIYFILVLYLQFLNINIYIYIFIHIFLNISAALLITRVSFPNLSNNRLIKAVGYLYLITFITIGTTISLFYIYGGSPFTAGIQKLLAGILILFLIGNFGWEIFQKYKVPEEFILPVTIYFQNRNVELTGLVDTGNSLTDPITNVPVIVVNIENVLLLFHEEIQRDLLAVEDDYIELMEIFQFYNMEERIRVLPFSDLGQENGLLLGLRPDLIELIYQNKVLKIKRSVIGLSKRKLDIDDEYQALIHPNLIKVHY